MFIAQEQAGTIGVVDPITNEIISEIPIDNNPSALAQDCALCRVYAVNAQGSLLSVIDTATLKLIANVPLGTAARVSASVVHPAANPNNHSVYIPVPGQGSLAVVSGFDNSVITTVGVGGSPVAAAVSQRTNLVYVANNTNTIPVINSNNNSVFTNIVLPGSAVVTDITADSCDNKIYALRSDGSIAVINGASNTVCDIITPPGGAAVIALDPSIALMYVINQARNEVLIYDTCTLQQIGTLDIPSNADTQFTQLAVNYLTHLVYVTDSGNNKTFVVDGGLNSVVAEVPQSGNAIVALNCNLNCPVCSRGGCCCCDTPATSEAALGILTLSGDEQVPASGQPVRFCQIKLDQGNIAQALGENRVQVQQSGVYELHLRLPLCATQPGSCYLHYAMRVNDNILLEDELHHNGDGQLRTAHAHHYERLSPGDIITVPVINYRPNHRTDVMKQAYLSVRLIGQ